MLKAFSTLEIFIFLFWRFVYAEKRLDKKALVNFKIYAENILHKYHAENEVERLATDPFLFFKKALYKLKASDQHLSFVDLYMDIQ